MKTNGKAYSKVLGQGPVHTTAILLFHLLIMLSSLGLMKEKPAKAAWSMESMRFLSAWDSLGFSLRNSRSKLLQSLGDFCGWHVRVNETKLTLEYMVDQMHAIIVTQMDFRNHVVCSEAKSQAHTTLGLKGGSTSLFSRACQLMVLKNACVRMSPTTPNLRLGSRSNNWNNEDRFWLQKRYKTFPCNTMLGRNVFKATCGRCKHCLCSCWTKFAQ